MKLHLLKYLFIFISSFVFSGTLSYYTFILWHTPYIVINCKLIRDELNKRIKGPLLCGLFLSISSGFLSFGYGLIGVTHLLY